MELSIMRRGDGERFMQKSAEAREMIRKSAWSGGEAKPSLDPL